MDQVELINTLTRTLLSIATVAVSEDPQELKTDLEAIKYEAKKALEIAGYDFELLMGGIRDRVTGNFEA
jgi:hypothetical protein